MNDLNQWEKALRSWTPRRPSADFKEKLFPAREYVAKTKRHSKLVWLLYAPAAACLLMAAAYISTNSNPQVICLVASVTSNPPAIAGTFAVPANVASHSIYRGQDQNVWSVATFDWTKAVSCLSTTGSFPPWKTNIQKL
jgi:hypothetical protein